MLISWVEGFYGSLLWGFVGLFLLDLISGILKSWFKHIPISSNRLRDSVIKLAGYMVLLTATVIVSKYEHSFKTIIPFVYYYFMFTEFKSVCENAKEIKIAVPGFLSEKINKEVNK